MIVLHADGFEAQGNSHTLLCITDRTRHNILYCSFACAASKAGGNRRGGKTLSQAALYETTITESLAGLAHLQSIGQEE